MAPRYGDRHDVRYTDQERSTCNVQLSTFNGVTERAHGGRNMGTDTVFWGPEQIEGQARCPVHRSGAFKVQRSTLSFQLGDRKGAWWAEYGDRHRVSPPGPLTRRTCQSAGRAVGAGCGAQGGIWGQTQDFFW